MLVSLAVIAAMLTVYGGLAWAYAGETVPLECRRSTGTSPPEPGFTVTREGTAWSGNWSVVFSYRWGGGVFPKSQLFLRQRDPFGDWVGPMQLTSLTPANWPTFHVLFEDRHPQFETLCNGDRLFIDGRAFLSGSEGQVCDRDENTIALYSLH